MDVLAQCKREKGKEKDSEKGMKKERKRKKGAELPTRTSQVPLEGEETLERDWERGGGEEKKARRTEHVSI